MKSIYSREPNHLTYSLFQYIKQITNRNIFLFSNVWQTFNQDRIHFKMKTQKNQLGLSNKSHIDSKLNQNRTFFKTKQRNDSIRAQIQFWIKSNRSNGDSKSIIYVGTQFFQINYPYPPKILIAPLWAKFHSTILAPFTFGTLICSN